VMVAETSWRELCRFDDPFLARAVATALEAMEFEVVLRAGDDPRGIDGAPRPGRAPYVLEVVASDWGDLADVLEEIIDEQQEFDRMLIRRQAALCRGRIVAVIGLTGAAELLLLLLLLRDW
jgi:hypothetical protein